MDALLPVLVVVFFIVSFNSCGRRADPVFVPSYQEESVSENEVLPEDDSEDRVILNDDEVTEDRAGDVAEPDAPTDLAAVYTGKSIVITWTEVLHQGVRSYRVYRSSGSGFHLAGETVTPAFTDRDVEPGMTYSYYVTAAGQSDSAGSEEIRVSTESESK